MSSPAIARAFALFVAVVLTMTKSSSQLQPQPSEPIGANNRHTSTRKHVAYRAPVESAENTVTQAHAHLQTLGSDYS